MLVAGSVAAQGLSELLSLRTGFIEAASGLAVLTAAVMYDRLLYKTSIAIGEALTRHPDAPSPGAKPRSRAASSAGSDQGAA